MVTAFQNVTVITPLARKNAMVMVKDGKIDAICSRCTLPKNAQVVDGRGMYLTPGFIDLHVHGGGGYTAMSLRAEDVVKMARAHAMTGTTSIVPTTLAAPLDVLQKAVYAVKEASERCTDSNILGIHLEGPFISKEQRGAQNECNCLIPAESDYLPLLDSWDKIRMMGAAPELPGALELGRALSRRGIVGSVAHSSATFEQVARAVEVGFRDVTHIYSGCSSVIRENGYRIAGVVEAGLAMDELTVQVIADLRHLPPSLIQLIYHCKGAEKISLITDALDYAATDLQEGTVYTQENGVQTVYEDGVMKLMDRKAFAGSVATSSRLVRNVYREVGISLEDSVRMATLTPASVLGIEREKGRIAEGFDADLLLLDENAEVKLVMVGGRIIRNDLNAE